MYKQATIDRYTKLFSIACNTIAKDAAFKMSPTSSHILSAALGGVGLAVPTYLIKSHIDEIKRRKTRNRAFGAGVATGVAAPHILRGAMSTAQHLGILPEHGAV